MKSVCITGVSGFVASHCALRCLEAGYRVRGTVRSTSNEDAVGWLKRHPQLKDVELVEADLLADEGWDAAMKGCDYCLHVASPFPIGAVEAGSLVKPAVEGTERALRAAKRAGIRRVVVTSSVAAISSGRTDRKPRTFTEADHSDVDHCDEYPKSKTLAEQRAWELAEELGLELATVNPSYVIGPLHSARDCSSAALVRRLLAADMPAVPRIWVPSVDVRDVADAHVAAMEGDCAGERYLLDSGEPMWMTDIARLLREEFGPQGFKVPRMPAPWLLVAVIGLWDKQAAALRSSIGNKSTSYDNAKATKLLGKKLRGPEDSYVAMGKSLIDLGVVKPPKK